LKMKGGNPSDASAMGADGAKIEVPKVEAPAAGGRRHTRKHHGRRRHTRSLFGLKY